MTKPSRRKAIRYTNCPHCGAAVQRRGLHGHIQLSRACKIANDIVNARRESRFTARRFMRSVGITP